MSCDEKFEHQPEEVLVEYILSNSRLTHFEGGGMPVGAVGEFDDLNKDLAQRVKKGFIETCPGGKLRAVEHATAHVVNHYATREYWTGRQ